MRKIIYRRSMTYGLILVGFFACTLIFAVFYGISRSNLVILCFLAPLSVISLGFIIYALKDNRPRVVLDDRGIAATEWGGMRIEWGDVLDVKVISLPRIISISLEVKNEEKYLAALSKEQRVARKISKQYYGQSFSFVATALDASTESICADIKQHIRSFPNNLA